MSFLRKQVKKRSMELRSKDSSSGDSAVAEFIGLETEEEFYE